MFRKLTKTLASAVSMLVVVASLAIAQGRKVCSTEETITILVMVASLAMAQSSKKSALDDTIAYEQGVVTTIDNTGMATVRMDRGVQYVVVLGNGLKVGDKVECTMKDGQTACNKTS
jgi:hypothetical protein